MIKIDYDPGTNAVVIEFSGDVDAEQVKRGFLVLDEVLAKVEKDFKGLIDYSAVETMEPEVEGEVLKAMDRFNAKGVAEIIRVLPDPELEIGFNGLSVFHYSPRVQLRSVRTRAEAEALLREKVQG